MNLINLQHISLKLSGKTLFDDLCWSLNENEKVGLIGVNGTGKSTLLKVIYGELPQDSGNIIFRNGLTMSYLPQHPAWKPGTTVLTAVLSGHDGSSREELTVQAKTMLTKLGVFDFSEQVEHLSGGQKKRLALVGCLLSGADVLLLDEPTNHLDSEMAEWLEEYLKNYRGALLMVTHDRYFLDSVTNSILELDRGKAYLYHSGYLGYLTQKEERERVAAETYHKQQNLLKIERAWMERGARARSTKQKAHIARFEALNAVKAPETDSELLMSSVGTRLGKTIIELKGISKCFGDRVILKDYTYLFKRGERVGYIGPNGCGKSTLMKMIAGLLSPDSGEIIIGPTVKIGYYGQELTGDEEFRNPEMRVIDYIRDTAEYINTSEGPVSASVMLDRFLFPPEVQYAKVSKLSGGEKRRLRLLRVLMEAPNVLILDEPTNDLDIRTLQVLEHFIDRFDGLVLLVSHDRYLLDRLATSIAAFTGDGSIDKQEGNYTDYYLKKEAAKEAAEENELPKASVKETKPKGIKDVSRTVKRPRFSYSEQREFEHIEEEIAGLEKGLAELRQEMLRYSSDYGKLQELESRKDSLEELLEQKTERWLYLTELYEEIQSFERDKA